MIKECIESETINIKKESIVIGANFTIEPIGQSLKWWCGQFNQKIRIRYLPYNQIFQNLIDPDSLISKNTGINILFIRFDDWLRDGASAVEQHGLMQDNLNQLKTLILNRYGTARLIVGILPIEDPSIQHMNNEWMEFLVNQKDIRVLDLCKMKKDYDIQQVYDILQNNIAHIPYTEEYFAALGTCIARKIICEQSPGFKAIALDCDNTLWKGICGEAGAMGVEVTKSYQILHQFLIKQYEKGVLLVLCSKNNSEDINDVFENNPGMLLRKEHIILERVNWNSKSKNLRDIAKELNIGLDSFLLIDDNPVECSEVMQNCPEVLTLTFPTMEEQIPDFLEHIWALDLEHLTEEDCKRTRMYQEETRRKVVQNTKLSFLEFVKTLGLSVSIREAKENEYARVSQLTNRTNQFNLSNIRRTENEIKEIASKLDVKCMVIEAEDRFGSYGISGVVIFEIIHRRLVVDTLLLSCRILGRNIEQVVLAFLYTYVKDNNIISVQADFYETEKNIPVKQFMEGSSWNKVNSTSNSLCYELNMKSPFFVVDSIQCYFGNELPTIIRLQEKQDFYIEFDHVAIAVHTIETSLRSYEEAGYQYGKCVYDENQNVKLVMCSRKACCNIELVQPKDQTSPAYNILQQCGEIPYHVCYRVASTKKILVKLDENHIKYEVISSLKKAVLFEQQEVMFVSIQEVGLVELIEVPVLRPQMSPSLIEECINVEVNLYCNALKFYQVLGYKLSKPDILEKPGFPQIRLIVSGIEKFPYKIIRIVDGKDLVQLSKIEHEAAGRNVSWDVLVENEKNLLHKGYLNTMKYHTGIAIVKEISGENTDNKPKWDESLQEFAVRNLKEILNRDKMDLSQSFLNNGGNSLKAVTFISRINRQYQVLLKIEDLFNNIPLEEVICRIELSKESERVPIVKTKPRQKYPLTEGQASLYRFYQLYKDSLAYNMPRVMIVDGKLDVMRFRVAVNELIHRYEVLRMNFQLDGEIPYQFLRAEEIFKLNIQVVEESITEKEIDSIIQKFIRPFDLERELLVRVELIKLKQTKYLFLFDVHHIISDGISMGVLVSKLVKRYEQKELKTIEVQFQDYIVWKQRYLETFDVKRQKKYWKDRFSGGIPVLQLPTDYEREPVRSFEGTKIIVDLGEELTQFVRCAIQETGVSLYMYLLSVYTIVLSKYSMQEDIIVGCPVAGRELNEIENTVGMFVSILPIWINVNYQVSFIDYLEEVKATALKAFENSYFPFNEIVSNITRDPSRNPIFDTVFLLQNMEYKDFVLCNMEFGEIESSELRFSLKDFSINVSKYDLTMEVVERGNNIYFSIEYCTKLYKEESIYQMFRYYRNVLEQVVADASISMTQISLMDLKEATYLKKKSYKVESIYSGRTIQEIFEQVVENTPEKVAVRVNGDVLTYQQLNQTANQVADYLRQHSVQPEELVGILLERSLYVPIAIIGIIKAGCAYMPIEPEYPDNRIDYMIKNSAISVLITDKENTHRNISKVKHLLMIDQKEIVDVYSIKNPEYIGSPDNLLYVIYTSGTAGNPKGVMIEQRSLINYVLWRIEKYQYTSRDVTLQLLPVAFDGFGSNFYSALLSGGELVYMNQSSWRDFKRIRSTIMNYGVTNFSVVPTMYRAILEEALIIELQSLRFVVLAGEKASDELVALSNERNKQLVLINEYGPTEGTVASTAYLGMGEKKENIIGTPLSNVDVYVVDKFHNILPRKIPGELCIGGIGLARGYFNNEKLTNEKFITESKFNNCRIYKTGDIVKFDYSGNLVYIGRADQQVKIKGYRVELSEIEKQLLQYPGMEQAVVLMIPGEEAERLCCYVVCKEPVGVEEIRDFLITRIPSYMIPELFAAVDQIPMTINGKVDQKKLIDNTNDIEESGEKIRPEGMTELRVMQLSKEILKRKKVGLQDNFFHLGGNSLKASRLIARISKVFQIDLPMHYLFKHPLIQDISEYIKQKHQQTYQPIEKTPIQTVYPMSSSQKRIYILSQLEDLGVSYNMPLMIRFHGRIDFNRLEAAVKGLIEQHEILRTTFQILNQEPVQIIHSKMLIGVRYIEQDGNELQTIFKQFIQPFHLEDGPLIRVQICRGSLDDSLLLDLHHIVGDGISIGVILKYLSNSYMSRANTKQELQYKDYAVWQKTFFESDRIKQQKQYWLNVFRTDFPVLNYKTDFTRPLQMGYDGEELKVYISIQLTQRIRELEYEQGCTAFMILLSVFYIVLARVSNQEDIVIGTPLAGRNHPDVETMIGNFVNTVALRNKADMEKEFLQFLTEVKESVIQAYENQDYQFEELVNALKIDKDMRRRPLFDIMFVMRNMEQLDVDFDHLAYQVLDFNTNVSKYDMTLTATEEEKGILLNFQYNIQLFEQDTMKKISKYYLAVLEGVLEKPKQRLGRLPMLSKEEYDCILNKFNHSNYVQNTEINIISVFKKQVLQSKEATAVIYQDQSITYGELDQFATYISVKLRKQDLQEGSIIAILANPSIEMIAAMLGVLYAGYPYLPIDSSQPMERIRYYLIDSDTSVLLVQNSRLLEGKVSGASIWNLEEMYKEAKTNRSYDQVVYENRMAYMIYTSGTTGQQKGVLVNQKGLLNYVNWFLQTIGMQKGEKSILLSSYAFDLGYSILYPTLLCGGELHLIDKKDNKDPDFILGYIKTNRIYYIKVTPTLFQMLQSIEKYSGKSEESPLKAVILGGERINVDEVKNFHSKHPMTRIYNHYGPTETTIGAIAREIDFTKINAYEKTPDIGKPITNMKVYILNKVLSPVPINTIGEIYIEGPGVAEGYYKKVELTKEKFIRSPFNPSAHIRMYKTGDYGRFLPDGNIEFIGREDKQIKVRGYRVELSEIQTVLLKHQWVTDVVIGCRKDKAGGIYLVAYYIASIKLAYEDLKKDLLSQLPEYMIPSYFVQVNTFPMNQNGKIDMKVLEQIELRQELKYEKAKTPLEEQLVKIWKEILGIKEISCYDNFFDIGGNSLLLIYVYQKVSQLYPGKIRIVQLFNYPTITKLAQYLEFINELQNMDETYQLEMPKDYFLLELDTNRTSCFEGKLSEECVFRLHRLCEKERVDSENILFGVFIYMLSQESNRKVISVQYQADYNKRYQVTVDFTEFKDFPTYFQEVRKKMNLRLKVRGKFMQCSYNTVREQHMIPLFIMNDCPESGIDIAYDLCIRIIYKNHQASVCSKYNMEWLQEEKVKEFLNNYIKVLRYILEITK